MMCHACYLVARRVSEGAIVETLDYAAGCYCYMSFMIGSRYFTVPAIVARCG